MTKEELLLALFVQSEAYAMRVCYRQHPDYLYIKLDYKGGKQAVTRDLPDFEKEFSSSSHAMIAISISIIDEGFELDTIKHLMLNKTSEGFEFDDDNTRYQTWTLTKT